MHAGKIAFENIQLFLSTEMDRKSMEKNYTKEWKRKFKRRLLTGRIVQSLFGSNRATSVFLALMNAFPFFAKKLIKSTHGESF